MRPSGWRPLVAATLLPLTTVVTASPAASGPQHPRDQVIDDPGFEDASVEPCFRGSGGADVRRTDEAPLTGSYSLVVTLPARSAATCRRTWTTPEVGTRLTGTLQVANPRERAISVCLSATVSGSASSLRACTKVGATALRKLTLVLPLGGREVSTVAWHVSAGKHSGAARLDEARLNFDTSSGCGAAPSGPPVAGSPCDQNATPGDTAYEPAALDPRDQRPYVPLADYTVAPAADPVAVRFKKYVDGALDGSPDYGWTPAELTARFAGSPFDLADGGVGTRSSK